MLYYAGASWLLRRLLASSAGLMVLHLWRNFRHTSAKICGRGARFSSCFRPHRRAESALEGPRARHASLADCLGAAWRSWPSISRARPRGGRLAPF